MLLASRRPRSCVSLAVFGMACIGLAGCGDSTPSRAHGRDSSASEHDGGAAAPTDGDAGAGKAASGGEKPGKADGSDAASEAKVGVADPAKPARDVEAGKADRKRFLEALDAGRVASKKGAHTEAIVKFREALDVNPTNAAALGELGWAAFKAGDLNLAETSTEQALRHADTDSQRGMLLYNLGRVAEARGVNDVAIVHYRRSLALRDNDTVRERLKALGGDVADTATNGLTRVAGTFATLEAACSSQVSAEECPNAAWGDGEADACSCAPKLEAPLMDGEIGLLLVQTTLGPSERSWHPAFKTPKGWVIFGAAEWEYNPGAFGIFEEVERVTSEVLGTVGEGADMQRFVRFHFVKSRHDSDMGICEIEFESHDLEVICAIKGDTAECTAPLYDTYSFSREVDRDLCDEETLKTLPTDSTPVKITYSGKTEWTMTPAPAIVISDVGTTGAPTLGLASRPLMLASGTYTFADLTRTLSKSP